MIHPRYIASELYGRESLYNYVNNKPNCVVWILGYWLTDSRMQRNQTPLIMEVHAFDNKLIGFEGVNRNIVREQELLTRFIFLYELQEE